MRFVCDSCRAQYMISDDKVGPRGVKVRCKKCGHVILVRRAEPGPFESNGAPPAPHDGQPNGAGAGPMSGAPGILDGVGDEEIGAAFDQALSPVNGAPTAAGEVGSAGASREHQAPAGDEGLLDSPPPTQASLDGVAPVDPATDAGAAHDWFVAVDEKQIGPLPLDEMRGLWNRGEIGPDSLCWRAGLADWAVISEIPELAGLLAPKSLKPVIVAPAPVAPHPSGSPGPVESAFSAGLAPRAVAVETGAGVAAAPSSVDEPGSWKPSAASALASLVKEEIEVLGKPLSRGAPVPLGGDAAALNDLPGPLINGHESAALSVKPMRESGAGTAGMPTGAAPEPYSSSYRPLGGGRARRGWIVGLSILGGVSLLALAVVTTMLVLRSGSPGPAASREPARPQSAAPSPSERAAAPPTSGQGASGQAAAGVQAAAPASPNPPPAPSAKAAGAPEPAPAGQPQAGAAEAKAEPSGTSHSDRAMRRERSRLARHASSEAITVPRKVERPEVASASPRNTSEDDFDRVFGGAEKRKSAIPKAEPKKPSSVYVPPAPGSSDIPDSLGTGDIMRVVVDNKPAIKQCVDEQRKRDASLSGKIVMSWTVLTGGRTTKISCASDEFKRSYMAQCLTGLIKGWQFPRHKVQGEPINFPFTF